MACRPRVSTSSGLGPAQPTAHDEIAPKRRKLDNASTSRDTSRKGTSRRKNACQSCRLRKVKCDAIRPTCGICQATDSTCHYTDPLPEKLTLDSATELLYRRLEKLQDSVDRLQESAGRRDNTFSPDDDVRRKAHVSIADAPVQAIPTESSSEFLQIPAHRTTADAVLLWEIFEGKYPTSALIGVHFSRSSVGHGEESNLVDEAFTVRNGVLAPNEERIPILVESFLQHVHTKNPVLDADQLVRQARIIASDGLGWDAWSCLVLMAAALGRIAKPFEVAAVVSTSPCADEGRTIARTSEAANTAEELEEAESYFVLACRRLGGLKHSLLGSQCFFFAGVYLMYTLRPLLSWQYFIHASTLFRLYMNTAYQLHASGLQYSAQLMSAQHKTTRRLEESMYWSCFKSEIEFRVELPLPQSELASSHHPQMFPSPRSPARDHECEAEATDADADEAREDSELPLRRVVSTSTAHSGDYSNPRQRVAHLCNEEESWYYYLTEIALRRIGNRIINTFFGKEPAAWLDIGPLLRIALEFDNQVSAWSANLPSAMKQWETNYAIKRPDPTFLPAEGGDHVLRELSWALENRVT